MFVLIGTRGWNENTGDFAQNFVSDGIALFSCECDMVINDDSP